jgi:ABC-type multidrug transport system ATPase subunit
MRKKLVDETIKMFDLEKYRTSSAGTLSGGN